MQRRADILKPMPSFSMKAIFASALLAGLLFSAAGCRSRDNPYDMSVRTAAWNASKQAAQQDLSEIPPPSKSIYLSIDQDSQWKNPFLTVNSNIIQLRIYLTDENTSSIDRGGMTRLSVARKRVLSLRPKDLPRALASLPDGAWPYGRVVAVGEQHTTPQNRAQLEKNVAITIRALDDMGIVVDDWTDPARRIR